MSELRHAEHEHTRPGRPVPERQVRKLSPRLLPGPRSDRAAVSPALGRKAEPTAEALMTVVYCPQLDCAQNEKGRCTQAQITLNQVNTDNADRNAPDDWMLCDDLDEE
jgi:hypothetical protein